MPVRFLTDAERERLGSFPREVPMEDLYGYFTLSGADRRAIPARTAPPNRLGFALALCAVRYLGFCPEDLTAAPREVVGYVGGQLGVPVEALRGYAEERGQTRTDHLKAAYEHLGFRKLSGGDADELLEWMVERALEHDAPTLLVSLAADRLLARKVVRPGVSRLERMAAEARERANERTFLAVEPLLNRALRERLDALLVPDPNLKGATPLSWLRQGASSNSAKSLLGQLEKLEYLRGLGADRWDTSAVNPNRLKLLAKLGRRYTAQALQRTPGSRRYPVLVALLSDSSHQLVDEAVDVFNQCLAYTDSRARRRLWEFRKRASRATDEKVELFGELARVILDESVPDERVREVALSRVGTPEELLKALEEAGRLSRPLDDSYFDFLSERYPYVRTFAPAFLNALSFRSSLPPHGPAGLPAAPPEGLLSRSSSHDPVAVDPEATASPRLATAHDGEKPTPDGPEPPADVGPDPAFLWVAPDPLLRAVGVLKELDAGDGPGRRRRRGVPEGVPLSFVPAKWRPHVVGPDGRVNRRYWELCVLASLRDALRSGDVWVEGGRRYADPQTFLIPKEDWPALSGEVRVLTGTSPDGPEHLKRCREELEDALLGIGAMRVRGGRRDRVALQAGRLLFPQDEDEGLRLPPGAEELRKGVADLLPKVDLTDLLFEVDRRSGFLSRLVHAGGSEPRTPDLDVHLLAAILAQATNVGPVRMADLAGLSYRKLAWCNTWYLREETLKEAVAAVVDFHHALPLSRRWGGGTLSSSDGQRFPVEPKAKNARANPRYFGYGKGVTFYTWTSDQFSQYGTKVIPSTVRDATYVLDGILGNETDLSVAEHTVDTHGFTEIVFALFGLLGLTFSPRIADVESQVLYGMSGLDARVEAEARHLLGASIDEALILKHWDDMRRIASSLKLGYATASLLVERLQARPRKGELAKALREYGRLRKTVFLLRYAQEPELRKRIGRQLNKGETLHALRRFLLFAGRGRVRKAQPEGMDEQALCLNLVTNAVVAWNTLYTQEALRELRAAGRPVRGRDLAHLSPAVHGHVNPYGRYRFDPEGGLPEDGGLRPLRNGGGKVGS